jgi:NAD(P)-dependent dehydrogenase (short-subunit alcohol dehydrogenase family)
VQIKGKRVIVTGGSSGLGEAAVRVLVREGAAVPCMDVDDMGGARVVASANAEGPGGAVYHVRHAAVVRSAFDHAARDLGGLDALIHFAGVDKLTPAESITEDEWDFIVDVNLKGTFLASQAAWSHMYERSGRIVNVTSAVALVAAPGRAHYSASKGGITALSRALAAEWGRYGINVVTGLPGGVYTHDGALPSNADVGAAGRLRCSYDACSARQEWRSGAGHCPRTRVPRI